MGYRKHFILKVLSISHMKDTFVYVVSEALVMGADVASYKNTFSCGALKAFDAEAR